LLFARKSADGLFNKALESIFLQRMILTKIIKNFDDSLWVRLIDYQEEAIKKNPSYQDNSNFGALGQALTGSGQDQSNQ
jgi:hypothetical protein